MLIWTANSWASHRTAQYEIPITIKFHKVTDTSLVGATDYNTKVDQLAGSEPSNAFDLLCVGLVVAWTAANVCMYLFKPLHLFLSYLHYKHTLEYLKI